MRNFALKLFVIGQFFLLVLFSLLNISCGPRPKVLKLSTQIEVNKNISKNSSLKGPTGLWFTSSNSTNGGLLGRIDLRTGVINRNIKMIGPDSIILPDDSTHLFLLSRMNHDGISRLKGIDAEVESFYGFAKGSNPQQALRDNNGQVWLTLQDSNEVKILNSSLSSQVGRIDLSFFAVENSFGGFADLSQIFQFDSDHLVVLAQRMHRSLQSWIPDRQSGLAVINKNTFTLESSRLLEIANPIQIGRFKEKTYIVGGGDYSQPKSVMGDYFKFTNLTFSDVESVKTRGKILGATINSEVETPLFIVWYPELNKSCIESETRQLVCEENSASQGYVFNSILAYGSQVFVSYYGNFKSELWIINFDNEMKIQKVAMNLPILSMSFGL